MMPPLSSPPRPTNSRASSSAAAASTSTSPPANSSYTASLPASYRRSSFPVSPAAVILPGTGSTSAPTVLPPGLSFERRGCRDDDDYERVTGTKAPFFPAYSSRSQSLEATPPATRDAAQSVGWLGNSGRSWSVNSATLGSEEKRKREAVKGWEDPALAAARRALWDDSDNGEGEETISEDALEKARRDSSTAQTGKDEISLLREKNRKIRTSDGGDDEAIEFDDEDEDVGVTSQGQVSDDAEGEGSSCDEEDSDSTPPALLRPPCHSTLSPGPSCLRSSSSSSRNSLSPSPRFSSLSLSQESSATAPSAASSIERGVSPSPSSSKSSSCCSNSLTASSTTNPPSIRFSLDPPKTVPTYSKSDYERKGDLPVEKLSIREWIELQGVREAVGVWSGKIAKWDENPVPPCASTLPGEDSPCGSMKSPSTTPTPNNSTISNGSKGGRPSLSLAALTGVVTVSKSTPNSPTSASSSPRIGSTSLATP